eukprot:SAG22_NODE_2672_length_2317_cov_6.085212_2_plen_175_part_00
MLAGGARVIARRSHHPPTFVATGSSHTGPCWRRQQPQLLARGMSTRKPGVCTDEEMEAFVTANAAAIVVVDARNPDFSVEPGDEKTAAIAPIGSGATRPRAVNLPFDRANKSMDLGPLEPLLTGAGKATPIITHCGGGGRGQKAKDFLLANGFTNVMNGGGPEEPELWKFFGEL